MYRTEPVTESGEKAESKKKRISSAVSVNSPGNPRSGIRGVSLQEVDCIIGRPIADVCASLSKISLILDFLFTSRLRRRPQLSQRRC